MVSNSSRRKFYGVIGQSAHSVDGRHREISSLVAEKEALADPPTGQSHSSLKNEQNHRNHMYIEDDLRRKNYEPLKVTLTFSH